MAINPQDPAIKAFEITPSDSSNLTYPIRCITINTSGTISFEDAVGNKFTTAELPVGSYPLFANKILATGTTATDITGWA